MKKARYYVTVIGTDINKMLVERDICTIKYSYESRYYYFANTDKSGDEIDRLAFPASRTILEQLPQPSDSDIIY